MSRRFRPIALLAALIACGDALGPKPKSATNAFVKVTALVSRTPLRPGDTATFSYSVENITSDSLTLTTTSGCQIKPELDQVAGPNMTPPPLAELFCPTTPTVRRLAAAQKQTFSLVLRGFDTSKPADVQRPGYLLTKGTFDASVLVSAAEIGGSVRSDWVRFEVKY